MKCYQISHEMNDEMHFAVFAKDYREAKRLGWSHYLSEWGSEGYDDYINLRVKWNKKIKVPKDAKKGIIDLRYGLINKIYGFVMNYDCEKCGNESCCELGKNNKIICQDCLRNEVKNGKRNKTIN